MGIFKRKHKTVKKELAENDQPIDLEYEKAMLAEQKEKLKQDNRLEKIKQEITALEEKCKVANQKNKKLAKIWSLICGIILVIEVALGIVYYKYQYQNSENDIAQYRIYLEEKINEYQNIFQEEENMLKEHLEKLESFDTQ